MYIFIYNMLLLKDILTEVFVERRSHSDKNIKVSIFDELSKFKDDDRYYIHFTNIEKVGINPQSKYATPSGVCAYKLKDIYDELISGNYLFASDSPYLNILTLNTNKILDFENYSETDKNRDYSKLKSIYDGLNPTQSFDEIVKEFINKGNKLYNIDSSVKFIYGLINYIVFKLKPNGSNVLFNSILRQLGYEALLDRTGTVHIFQPSQAIFLTKNSYKVVKTILNKKYRKNDELVSASSYWHKGVNPTVDMVVLKKENEGYKILLIKRKNKTEFGKWALPGGFIDTNAKKGEEWTPGRETPIQAAIRELNEETGLSIQNLAGMVKEIGVYEGNNRNPRDTKESWSKSHAFGVILPDNYDTSKVKAKDDASDFNWFDIKQLPVLAFDHGTIISDALNKLI